MRLDLFFSTYIIIWCFLYYYKIIKFNPLIFLIIAIITSFLILFIFHNNNFNYKIYILFNLIKIPCIFLLDFFNIIEGLIFGIFLYIIYLIYIYIINKKNKINIYYNYLNT